MNHLDELKSELIDVQKEIDELWDQMQCCMESDYDRLEEEFNLLCDQKKYLNGLIDKETFNK